jgi:hypothetical protein
LGPGFRAPEAGGAGAQASRSIPAPRAVGRSWGLVRFGPSPPRRPASREARNCGDSLRVSVTYRLRAQFIRGRGSRKAAAAETLVRIGGGSITGPTSSAWRATSSRLMGSPSRRCLPRVAGFMIIILLNSHRITSGRWHVRR